MSECVYCIARRMWRSRSDDCRWTLNGAIHSSGAAPPYTASPSTSTAHPDQQHTGKSAPSSTPVGRTTAIACSRCGAIKAGAFCSECGAGPVSTDRRHSPIHARADCGWRAPRAVAPPSRSLRRRLRPIRLSLLRRSQSATRRRCSLRCCPARPSRAPRTSDCASGLEWACARRAVTRA